MPTGTDIRPPFSPFGLCRTALLAPVSSQLCLVADSNAVIVIDEDAVFAAILVMIIRAPVKAELVVDDVQSS